MQFFFEITNAKFHSSRRAGSICLWQERDTKPSAKHIQFNVRFFSKLLALIPCVIVWGREGAANVVRGEMSWAREGAPPSHAEAQSSSWLNWHRSLQFDWVPCRGKNKKWRGLTVLTVSEADKEEGEKGEVDLATFLWLKFYCVALSA